MIKVIFIEERETKKKEQMVKAEGESGSSTDC